MRRRSRALVLLRQGCSRRAEHPSLADGRRKVPTPTAARSYQQPCSEAGKKNEGACAAQAALLLSAGRRSLLFPQVDSLRAVTPAWRRAGRAGARTARSRLLPNGAPRRRKGAGRAGLPPPPPRPTCSGFVRAGPAFLSLSFSPAQLPMAAWFGFRAEEDEEGDEASFWRYDSTWEEDDDEDEDGDEGQPEGAEAAAGEEPEDSEKSALSSPREPRQAQVGAGRPSGFPRGSSARSFPGGRHRGRAGRAAEPCVHLPRASSGSSAGSSTRLPMSVHLPGPAAFRTACIFWALFPSYPDLQPRTGAA